MTKYEIFEETLIISTEKIDENSIKEIKDIIEKLYGYRNCYLITRNDDLHLHYPYKNEEEAISIFAYLKGLKNKYKD